jgi:DNA-binding NarL/FixJ family response regulator
MASLDVISIRPNASAAPHALSALGLTRRQAEVLQLVSRGERNADIAASLSISEHTVRHHLEDIYRRLGVTSRVAAAHAATRALAAPPLSSATR